MQRERQRHLRWRPRSGSTIARVGDYVLGAVLGRGGMGTVFRARHIHGGEEVAVKMIAPHLMWKGRAARRFEAEAAALRRIDHPNVVRMLDFGRLPGGLMYQVTEMLHGELLTHLLERRGLPLSAEETVPIVLQICAGLQAAHDRSVVHRDIKPDNIFVVQEDPLQLKLLDFGVARLLDTDRELTAEGIMLGTPRFASPEQAMGLRRNVDPRTDVYSLGVLAYFMLCGEPPFVGDIAALLAGHAEQPPPPLAARAPQVPQPVARVVHWCLEKQAEQRPPSARALANAFAGAVAVSRPRRKTRLRCAVLAKDHGAGSEAEERKTVCARPKPAHGSKPGVADRQVACSQPDPHPAYRATVPAGRRGRPEGEPVPPRVPPPPPVQQPETGQIRGRHERKHRAWVMPVLANFVLLSIAALTALTIALIN